MTNIVICPNCKVKRVVKSRQKFFRCCGVLNSVEDNLIGHGVSRYEVTKKVPAIPKKVSGLIEVEVV